MTEEDQPEIGDGIRPVVIRQTGRFRRLINVHTAGFQGKERSLREEAGLAFRISAGLAEIAASDGEMKMIRREFAAEAFFDPPAQYAMRTARGDHALKIKTVFEVSDALIEDRLIIGTDMRHEFFNLAARGRTDPVLSISSAGILCAGVTESSRKDDPARGNRSGLGGSERNDSIDQIIGLHGRIPRPSPQRSRHRACRRPHRSDRRRPASPVRRRS